jgi:hypothetical protein
MGASSMSAAQPIRGLFASDISRNIEEVIKVDQRDEEIIRDEISEYVVTDSILKRYTAILERYAETPNQPHEGIGIWVSGFYGSGKSSFAKLLGYAIQNHPVAGIPAGKRFAERAGDNKLSVLLAKIGEQIPTHAVIFDVATDRGIRSGNQTLTEITYRLFLESLGYAKDLDVSELEIELEKDGRLEAFEAEFKRIYGREWSTSKTRTAFALSEASRTMHELDPKTYPQSDTWAKDNKGKTDVTPGTLAKRADELMKRRRPGHTLMVVIDEVGQFVARDVQKMLDLQAMVQSFGVVSRGRHWLVVTSQERLGELVSGLDDKRVEHARLMDRFPSLLQVHLESTDIAEVTGRRVLAKNAAAQATLGALFDENRARLSEHTRVSADIKLPELTREKFIDLYPLLPYQVDLIIGIVSGLRSQGGTSPHVGGANRTIIKLAQQLLIHPDTGIADLPVGALATLDRIYDLVQGNLTAEVRAKITDIPSQLPDAHPLAQPVAKAICMLQYVKSFKRTPENLAACLHPGVSADSVLAAVRDALAQLEAAHFVRNGEDGYRIPSPAEDDWERIRNGASPKPGDAHRIYQEVIESLWQPQPSHLLQGVKQFRAGLAIRGRTVVEGDITFQVHLADDERQMDDLTAELRARSRTERSDVFWAVGLNGDIDDEVVELHRSRTVIAVKERDARTQTETTLVAEERRRRDGHQAELRRRLAAACLTGSVFFRGNDRSPAEGTTDIVKAATTILATVTPEIFERFKEAPARTADAKKGTDALLVAANLRGLPAVFGALGLLRDEKGNTVFATEHGPLAEVLGRITERADYGHTANGRWLETEFEKEPFGWDFEVVRLLALCLLRAGTVEATSRGVTFDSATSAEAVETFSNNASFRQASFRPRKQVVFADLLVAAEAFKDTFGSEIRELVQSSLVAQLRTEIDRATERVSTALMTLNSNRLPGAAALEAGLEPMRAILRGPEDGAVGTFNASHRSIKDAVKRAAELEDALTGPRLADLDRAQRTLSVTWPALHAEADLDEAITTKATELTDLLARETFFRDLAAIDQAAAVIAAEHGRRHEAALERRISAYEQALDELRGTPGWMDLSDDLCTSIGAPLERGRSAEGAASTSLRQLRDDTELCPVRLNAAVEAVARAVDGDRIEKVNLRPFFAGGIETEEQLDAALTGIREECERLIGAGKKIVLG